MRERVPLKWYWPPGCWPTWWQVWQAGERVCCSQAGSAWPLQHAAWPASCWGQHLCRFDHQLVPMTVGHFKIKIYCLTLVHNICMYMLLLTLKENYSIQKWKLVTAYIISQVKISLDKQKNALIHVRWLHWIVQSTCTINQGQSCTCIQMICYPLTGDKVVTWMTNSLRLGRPLSFNRV